MSRSVRRLRCHSLRISVCAGRRGPLSVARSSASFWVEAGAGQGAWQVTGTWNATIANQTGKAEFVASILGVRSDLWVLQNGETPENDDAEPAYPSRRADRRDRDLPHDGPPPHGDRHHYQPGQRRALLRLTRHRRDHRRQYGEVPRTCGSPSREQPSGTSARRSTTASSASSAEKGRPPAASLTACGSRFVAVALTVASQHYGRPRVAPKPLALEAFCQNSSGNLTGKWLRILSRR